MPQAQVLFFLFLFLLSGQVSSQSKKDPAYLGREKEVGFPLPYLSPITGTFAEIRNHNLHLGSDFKSYGLNGHSVLATFDGYVDEIQYSPIGYGLSFHLYSPSLQLKSKYAHLHSFQGKLNDLENLRKALFFLGEKGGFTLKLPSHFFPAKRGEPIAKTGETGSGISHLHLEFRTEKGVLNPLYFPDYQQKDETPPTLQFLLFELVDSGATLLYKIVEKRKGTHVLLNEDNQEIASVPLHGKVRVRLAGFDRIRARNKNNVYGMDLKKNGELLFQRVFDYLHSEDGTKKHQFYDLNRSSLSPPLYFYHLYDRPKDFQGDGFSFDLGTEPNNEIGGDLEAGLRDAAGNRSFVKVAYHWQTDIPPQKTTVTKTKKVYISEDKLLQLDFSKAEVSGKGDAILTRLKEEEALPFSLPQGISKKSQVYRVETQGFSWKGDALGTLQGSSTSKNSLFFWDSSLKRFSFVSQQKKPNGFSFQLQKVGYLFIIEDGAPPQIFPMTTLARNIELPSVADPCFEIRYYGLSDVGVGFRTNVEILLEGQPYPYEYDPDRKAVRVEVPKSLAERQSYLLLEARGSDFAGNTSPPFLDVIATEGWKKEKSYASCPVKE